MTLQNSTSKERTIYDKPQFSQVHRHIYQSLEPREGGPEKIPCGTLHGAGVTGSNLNYLTTCGQSPPQLRRDKNMAKMLTGASHKQNHTSHTQQQAPDTSHTQQQAPDTSHTQQQAPNIDRRSKGTLQKSG